MDERDAEIKRLREVVARQEALIMAMAERIYAAHQIIGKNAEKKPKPKHRCWLAERYAGRRCDAQEKRE